MAMDEEYCFDYGFSEQKSNKNNKEQKKEGKILKEYNGLKNKSENLEELHATLLDKKSAIKEINSVIENIITERMKNLKFSKIKLIFKMEKNITAMIFLGMLIGLLGTSLVSIIFSLINGSFDILWGLSSTAISLFGLSFLGSVFLKEFYSEDITRVIRQEILSSEEINSENLMKLNVFFDKEDKRYISDMNDRNNGIHLTEVVEILKNKKRWVEENESSINEKMKVKYNREILESA